MQKILFETVTLADAAQRAARVAPVKGVPFDRAAGIVVTANPDYPGVTLMSTDLTVTFRTVISILGMELNEEIFWRLPAALFTGIVSALPMAAGSTVTLAKSEKESWVYIIAGAAKSKLAPITLGSYPIIDAFDPEGMMPTPGLASRLSQVSWACASGDTVLAGIHMNGESLIACDKAQMATVPCIVPLESPVTAPLTAVSGLLRTAVDVTLRATDKRLEIMPDPHTQLTSLLYADPYPDTSKILTREIFTGQVTVPTEPLLAALNRMMVLVRGERLPRLRLKFNGDLNLDMDVEEVGRMIDKIETSSSEGPEFEIEVTPSSILDALTASGRSVMKIDYGPTPASPLRFKDDNGLLALIMPRMPTGSA